MLKKENLLKTVSILIGGMAFILFVLVGIKLIIIDIIPNKYLYLITGLLLCLGLILLIGPFFYKKRGKIINSVFGILFSLIMVFALNYSSKFQEFIQEIVKNEKTVEYYFVVSKNNSDELEDYIGEIIGIIETDIDNTKKLLEKINFNDYTSVEENMHTLISSLQNNLIQAIVINSNGLEILKDNYEEFDSDYKIILVKELTIDDTTDKKSKNLNENAYIVYISGIDTYGNIGKVSRSDVNILAVINPKTSKILLIHIPRDSYMQFAGIKSNLKDKLTHSGVYGINTSVKTLENFFEIDINYYIRINFSTLVDAVDIVGGITVYNDETFDTIWDTTFNQGYLDLNGKTALQYARERKHLTNGDIGRGSHQQDIIEALLKKVATPKILLKYTEILNTLKYSFETNMNESEMNDFVKLQLQNNFNWQIESYSLTGAGTMKKTYTYPNRDLYVMELNENKVNTAKDKIKSYLN